MIPDSATILAPLALSGFAAADIHAFEKLESTSVWLRDSRATLATRLAQGRPQVCVTDWQSAGLGRRGKSWQTAPGNITFSLLSRVQRPVHELMGLSLVTGIAVAETLAANYPLHVELKWPNDLILDNRKLGGLLTEVVGAGAENNTAADGLANDGADGETDVGCQYIVTGIGINVRHDSETTGLGLGSVSLESAGFDLIPSVRDALIGKLCASVLVAHDEFLDAGWGRFAERWKGLDWLLDKEIAIHKAKATEHAFARGVDEQGALLIERAGEIHPLFGGDVSVRPLG